MSRFGTCPRQTHLELILYTFGYFKKFLTKSIVINSRSIKRSKKLKKNITDFVKKYVYVSQEKIDPILSIPIGPLLEISGYFDSDHGHDQKTRRSITGFLGYVGSTPVTWFSKRQGAMASSTYKTEFSVMRTGTEKIKSFRYMLRCLGITLDGPSMIYSDNLNVIQNISMPDTSLKKTRCNILPYLPRKRR